MALRLEIVSRHRQGLGERGSMEFGHNGGTIGRSLESDWVLPDSQRYLSSRHASIDFRSGSYYVVDTSTNGVYVNDAEQPVGRGNPQRLFTGDRIRLGEYEISVEITDEEDTPAMLSDDRHVDPVSKAQRVPAPEPTRADMVAPHEITGVGIEVLLGDKDETGETRRVGQAAAEHLRLEEDLHPLTTTVPSLRPPAATPAEPAPRRMEPPPVSAAARLGERPAASSAPKAAGGPPAAKPPPPVPPAMTAARPTPLDAFFRGAGLPAQRLDEKQAEQLLQRLGQLMREVVLGARENLRLRAEQKSVLGAPTTTQPQNDNPLKSSASVEDALTNLLLRDSAEALSAVDAVRETFGDVKQHQQRLWAAVRTALVDYVGRLDPVELENKIGSTRGGALLNAANKLKYWDLFKDLYQVVALHEPGQFPQQFLDDLGRAYEHEESRSGAAAASRHTKLG
jgi:type VI secretion system protein